MRLILIVLSILNGIAYAQDAYAPERNSHRFAQYLFDQGDYRRAAGEYQRLLIGDCQSMTNDSLKFVIANCFYCGQDFSRAAVLYRNMAFETKDSTWRWKAVLGEASACYQMGQYLTSRDLLLQLDNVEAGASLTDKGKMLEVGNELLLKDWCAAGTVLSKWHPCNTDLQDVRKQLLILSDERIKYKSPIWAATMSTFIPGLGKAYAGRKYEGIYSLLLITITGWQAYDGFHRDGANSTKGWIYGLLTVGFHAGNIYGSSMAVWNYNDAKEGAFNKKVRAQIAVYDP